LLDGFSKMATDESLLQNTYDAFGGTADGAVADGIFFGLPSMLGVSLSGNATSPGANPARDIQMMFSLVMMDRARALGQAFGLGMDHYEATGENPLRDENTRNMVLRAIAPKTIYRVAAAYEENAIKSLRNSLPQMNDASIGERAMYMAGFTPIALERKFRVADELYNKQQTQRQLVQTFGEALWQAQQDKDWVLAQKITARAIAQGVDFSSVLRSVQARTVKGNEDMIERKFDPVEIFKRRNILGE